MNCFAIRPAKFGGYYVLNDNIRFHNDPQAMFVVVFCGSLEECLGYIRHEYYSPTSETNLMNKTTNSNG